LSVAPGAADIFQKAAVEGIFLLTRAMRGRILRNQQLPVPERGMSRDPIPRAEGIRGGALFSSCRTDAVGPSRLTQRGGTTHFFITRPDSRPTPWKIEARSAVLHCFVPLRAFG
jgi:hypothetical protein